MYGVVERTADTPILVVDVPPGTLGLQAWVILRGRSAVNALFPMSPTRWCCEVTPVGSSQVTLRVAYVRIDPSSPIQAEVGNQRPAQYTAVGGGQRQRVPLQSLALSAEGVRDGISVFVRRDDDGPVSSELTDPDRWMVDLGAPYGAFVQHKPSSAPLGPRTVGLASGEWHRARQPLSDDARATLSHSFCRLSKR
jgi:hypothetical protein